MGQNASKHWQKVKATFYRVMGMIFKGFKSILPGLQAVFPAMRVVNLGDRVEILSHGKVVAADEVTAVQRQPDVCEEDLEELVWSSQQYAKEHAAELLNRFAVQVHA